MISTSTHVIKDGCGLNGLTTQCSSRVNLAHGKELMASGLPDVQINVARLYTVTGPKVIAALLRWENPATNLRAALVFPFGCGRLKPARRRKAVAQ